MSNLLVKIMLNLFVIHWNAEELHEYITPFLKQDWNVGYEYRNEMNASDNIKILNPDVIIIYLTIAPARGRLSASFIKKSDLTNKIPIIFVDGKNKDVKKMRNEFPEAKFTSKEELQSLLISIERLKN
jgi:hypothetical protein